MVNPELVTVIVPIRNEVVSIEETLRAALAQDYPRELLEVLVIDGMSEDGTRDIVQRLAAADPRLRMLDNPRRITPPALNIGIRAARGAVIVRVDGHGVLPPDYVRECVGFLSRKPMSNPAAAGGPSAPDFAGTPAATADCAAVVPGDLRGDCVGGAWDSVGRGYVGKAIALAMGSALGVGNSRFRTWGTDHGPVVTDTVPYWAVRREVFERIGFFRETMLCHEDYEFNYRLRRAGGTVLLLPWLRAKYYVRSTLAELAWQYGRYGFWKGRFLRSQPASVRLRHVIPTMFAASLVVLAVAAFFGPGGRLGLGLLAAIYAVYLLAATVSLARLGRLENAARPTSGALRYAPGLRLAPLLPIILVILHLAYGGGVWFGLIRGKERSSEDN